MSSLTPRQLFAQRLRSLRQQRGLSQRTLGRRIGLSEDVISSRVTRYETGASEPDFDTAGRLADALGVPLASLFATSEVMAELIGLLSALPEEQQQAALVWLQQQQR